MPDPTLIPSDRKALRTRFRTLRDSLQGEARQLAETAIIERLFSLPAWREADLICGYISMRGELNTDPIWARAAAEGKDYSLPVTVTGAGEGRMVFRRTEGYAPHSLIPARFDIPEPPCTCPTLTPSEFSGALILVPGLVFDGEGYRLGYGGGYYDRFLASLRDAAVPVTTVGLAFSCCRIPRLPREAFDIPVDLVLDDTPPPVTPH